MFTITGTRVNSITFVDGVVLLEESQNYINKMLNILVEIFDRYQLKINGQKTKIKLVSK